MKKRLPYLLSLAILLAAEICIGLFAHDALIRPFVGDMLITPLLCCLLRIVFPKRNPALPVFGIAVAVELWQWLELPQRLGLADTIWGVILGTSADWRDVACYAVGCLAFAGAEYGAKRICG